jgi:serine/threonine protein kinase
MKLGARFTQALAFVGRSPAAAHACIAENTLAAYAEGQLDQDARGAIEGHLAECEDCRAVLGCAASAGRSRRHATVSSTAPANDAGSGQLSPGMRVGRYVIERLVGQGAMGSVYAAVDPDLERKVAVKILRAQGLSPTELHQMRARLLREAKAMARLSHPEVIVVHDVGTFDEQLFVAMEFVDGETLRQWRAARHRTCAEILAVYERAGRGLAAAHDAGLVHRDFKPDNVLIGHDGRVRVTDFGVARSMDDAGGKCVQSGVRGPGAPDAATETTLTRAGTLLGTPAYMAPEQLRGGAADARSDIFSFAVALYEALYGERPFAGSTGHQLLAAIERGGVRAPPVMSRAPSWVRRVLLHGLRAAPEERFASMRALLDALRARQARHRWHVRTSLGIASTLLVTFVAAAVYRGRSPSASTPRSMATQEVAAPIPLPSAMASVTLIERAATKQVLPPLLGPTVASTPHTTPGGGSKISTTVPSSPWPSDAAAAKPALPGLGGLAEEPPF